MGPKGFGQVGESRDAGCSRGCDKMCGSSRAPACGTSRRTEKFGRDLPRIPGSSPDVTSCPGVWGPLLPKKAVFDPFVALLACGAVMVVQGVGTQVSCVHTAAFVVHNGVTANIGLLS
jgi:hypothetical protein